MLQFHDTTSESKQQVLKFEASNENQDQKILSIIEGLKKPFSAKDVFNNFPNNKTPITSIRRSINTLCHKLFKIETTGNRVPGLYGRNELEYKLSIV